MNLNEAIGQAINNVGYNNMVNTFFNLDINKGSDEIIHDALTRAIHQVINSTQEDVKRDLVRIFYELE